MSLQLKKSEQLGNETAESGLLFVMKSVEEKFPGAVKKCNIIT